MTAERLTLYRVPPGEHGAVVKHWSASQPPPPRHFVVEQREVRTPEDLLALLTEMAARQDVALTLGSDPISEAESAATDPQHRPGLLRRGKVFVHERMTRVVDLDIDGADLGLDPLTQWPEVCQSIASEVRGHLGAGTACIVMPTGSAGRPGKPPHLVRARAFVLLDEPVQRAEIAAWVRTLPAWLALDASIYDPARLIFVGRPDTCGQPDPFGYLRVPVLVRGEA